MGKFSEYMQLFKVKQSALLILSGVLGAFAAGYTNIDIYGFTLFIIASILSVFGTTGLNMYYDMDIDAIMFRTRLRPLPDKRLDPDEAFFVSLLMAVIGIILGFQLGFWVGLAIFLGFFIDAFIYTILLKRRTILNIVLGAFAGGMLPFGGYVFVTGKPDIYAFLLMLIVSLWAIIHIWFIAIYYIEDYRAANIPMFPVIYGETKTAKLGILVVLAIEGVIFYMWYTGFCGIYSLAISGFMALGIIISVIRYLRNNSKELVRKIFKFLSPYLGITLLTIAMEKSFLVLFV